MPSGKSNERWFIVLGIFALGTFLLLQRLRPSPPSAPASSVAQPTLIPVPSDPPTPAAIAELQARNKGLHWVAIDARTVLIITAEGSCGTLTGLAPSQVNFHTGRYYDREPHLYSSWSDAYAAAEQYCEVWSINNQHPATPAK